MAGTVRRGKTEKEDEMLEKQLLDDAKQCAEHIMLVDLARNDVGKVLFYHLKLTFMTWDDMKQGRKELCFQSSYIIMKASVH